MIITLPTVSSIKCQVGDFTLLANPQKGKKANILLQTKTDLPIDSFSNRELILGPGEYEISGTRIKGIELSEENSKGAFKTAYSTEIDSIRASFIVDISKIPTKSEIDALGNMDILFLGITGKEISQKELTTFIKQNDPKFIIPTDDKTAEALKEALGQKPDAEEKFVIKKNDLAKESATQKIIWLKTK